MSRDGNKVAIVTGGSRGIGAAIAERLAGDGFTVVINYAGKMAEAEAQVAKIRKAGGRALTEQADVSDAAAVRRMFDAVEEACGGVDVLVNNAGIMRLATLEASDDALIDSQIAINLKGTINTLREASRRLREGGRIINMSSSVVGLYQPTYAVYAATKAGVEAMTHILSRELRGRNITVNAVAPGPRLQLSSWTASRRRSLTASQSSRRSSDLASRKTSPTRSPFWPVRMAYGSTVKYCAPTAGPSERFPQLIRTRANEGTSVMNNKIILVTGASSGFGRLAAEALAKAGHTVYASMRDTKGRNKPHVEAIAGFSRDTGADLRTVELDVQSQPSVNKAVEQIIAAGGRIDVLMHNAGHMVFGPAEAFTPEQYAQLYDVNVLSTQRVNRAVLPHMRRQKQGLLVWVSSSSSAGGTPPYLAPYFGAKAAMDAIAVQYARELSRWGIETSLIVPGAFTSGTNHFAHAGRRSARGGI
jgi:NAD(P)-dependent dehydrogenase (short-subunit alcohol dehydrogenase family)